MEREDGCEGKKERNKGGREGGNLETTVAHSCHAHWPSASSQCFRTPGYKPLCTRHWVIFRMLLTTDSLFL